METTAGVRARQLVVAAAAAPALQGSVAGSLLFGLLELWRDQADHYTPVDPTPSSSLSQLHSTSTISEDTPLGRPSEGALVQLAEDIQLWWAGLDYTHVVAFFFGLLCDTCVDIYVLLRRSLRHFIQYLNRLSSGRGFARLVH